MSRLSDSRLSFNEVPEIYDEIRPTYPPALFRVLFQLLPPAPEIIEVGPGTGQATRDLLRGGASVHAVEIGPATAARLRSNLPTDRLQVTVGDVETVELADQSTDAVFSATAYHWISPAGQTGLPAKLLRPGGVVAIVDLTQVSSAVDRGFFDAAQPVYERYGQGHTGPPAPVRDAVDPPMRRALADDDRFEQVTLHRWDWDQTYTASGYGKLMRSYSGTQMMDATDREGLVADMESFIETEFDGTVTRPLVASLTTAILRMPDR